jgi:hypothetical protein
VTGEHRHHPLEVHPGARPDRLAPVLDHAAEPDPGRDQPVYRDVEGQHVNPVALGAHHQRRTARAGGAGRMLLAHQAGRGELGRQRQDGAAVDGHPLGQRRAGQRTGQVYVSEQRAETRAMPVHLTPSPGCDTYSRG